MEYIGRVNQAAVSCADGFLTVWDLETFKLLRYVRLRDVQVGLRFCPAMGVLTSWGVDEFNHEIIVWDVDKLTVLHVLDGHSEAVKDIYEVAPAYRADGLVDSEKPWEPMLVTTGMDRKVVLWDLRIGFERTCEPRKLFVLVGHYHGVLSLAYSSEHDLILSAGFDFDANCWDRSTSHLHMKLVGHRVSLIGVVVVEHETQRAVTGDEGGSFRVWDIQRGHSDHGTCLQSFSLRNARVSPRSMVVVWNEGLVVAGSKMHVFRAAPSVPVEASPLGVWFSSYTGELCVVLREAVMFDAETGKVQRRICQQGHRREITAFCMDARHKKAVVGDQRGGLRMYDGITGRWIMSANPHRSEVSALLFIDEDNAFISAGWDGMIQVHDARVRSLFATRSKTNLRQAKREQAPIGHRCAFTLRSVVNAHDGDITLVAASARLGLIATASSDLTVRLWDYQLLRLEDIIVAHRQEITCIRFLDPLPCLATADMTGKVLLWATRPHPNGGTLLLVLRNTVMTVGESLPAPAPGVSAAAKLASKRGQRRVLPTPVTCIAFRHQKPSGSDPTDAAGAKRTSQKAYTTMEPKAATAAAEGSGGASDRQDEKDSTTAKDTKPPAATVSSPWEVGSILFTGDELGSVKVWDLTDILLDKLGPAACGARAAEDKATIPPASFGSVSHHFVHYRRGPLDGVGLQAGVRFKELIDIARVLRRGEHLKATKPESASDASLCRAGLGGGGGVLGGGRKKKRPEARSSAGSLSSRSSTTERSRDRPLTAGRRKRDRGSDANGQTGSSPNRLSAIETASDASDRGGAGKQRGHRPVRAKEQAEATLNARPDDIHPVASWAGHKDCITFMQTISNPPSIVTGSLDSSARIFSFDGSVLGVMSEKQHNDGRNGSAWVFQPPARGRDTEASARAAALEQTLQNVRREERQPARPGVFGATTAPPRDMLGHERCTLSFPPDKAPNHGSELGTTFAGWRRHCAVVKRGNKEENGGVDALDKDEAHLRTQSAISAACLSRISELTQKRVAVEVAASSDTGSDNPLRTAEDGIEARLLSEAREGREYQRHGASNVRQKSSSDGIREPRHKRSGFHQPGNTSNVSSEPPPPAPKLPPNLTAERERKEARRPRSTLQFLSDGVNRMNGGAGPASSFSLPIRSRSKKGEVEGLRVAGRTQGGVRSAKSRPFTSPGTRPKSPDNNNINDKFLVRDDTATLLESSTALSPAAKLRHAVMLASPYLALKLQEPTSKQRPSSNPGGRKDKQSDAEGGARTGRGEPGRGGDDNTPQTAQIAENGGTTIAIATATTTKLTAMPLFLKSSSAARMVVTQRSTANMLFTQRSAMTLASARSNRSNKSCLSMTRATTGAAVSTRAAVARRMAADRRLRRMDDILDGVRRLGQRERTASRWSLTSRADDDHDSARRTLSEESGEAAGGGWGESGAANAIGRGAGAGARTGAVVVSARIQEVLSRFDRSVNGEDGDEDDPEDIEFNNQADQRARNMRRQLEARTAARQEAIRHNERYRKAQRYNLVTLQETQLRRQEAMVGLAGPSGERFGPYTLDDVLEFRVFANNLSLPGAEQLTVRGLAENAEIQADLYFQALLQELIKSGVLHWNQSLSMEDLMQLVFHFAKHDEAKRMMAVMDIAVLLERVRDAFVADKDSLVGRNGSLPFHFMNDIDMAFRTTGAEACGTCTLKELYGIMSRVGSDLFPCGQEDLEALAGQCGITDGHSELTADDFKALLTKLVSLHHHQHQGGDYP
eukprot:g9808.t1